MHMSDVQEMLARFEQVAAHPKAQLDAYLDEGRRVIGVGPYHVPEEIIHAAGAVPFGVWGMRAPVSRAKEYFPPFYCSICQTTLEAGLAGNLDGLSGLVVTGLCDTLRAFSQNWRVACGQHIPMIFLANAQNRGCEAGLEFQIASYGDFRRDVEECAGALVTDEALSASIRLYNQWRAAMREFLALAAQRPAMVSNAQRVAVVNSGYYMDKAEHLEALRALNQELSAAPADPATCRRVVLSGIYEDISAITDMLDEMGYVVVADDLAKESRALSRDIVEQGDPLVALARGWCSLSNDSVLYDPCKRHVEHVVEIARDAGADGVILLLAKFCDPEEFDAPLVARACREAGIPFLSIEVDQSTESYGQARTQLETFADLIE